MILQLLHYMLTHACLVQAYNGPTHPIVQGATKIVYGGNCLDAYNFSLSIGGQVISL